MTLEKLMAIHTTLKTEVLQKIEDIRDALDGITPVTNSQINCIGNVYGLVDDLAEMIVVDKNNDNTVSN